MATKIATASLKPRLQMRGVSKRFGATLALEKVDFSVFPGEIHALVGENGAGKSTLMKILSGAYQPDQGSMYLENIPYLPQNPLDGRQKGVGMIYQELSLAPHLTVAENIMLGMEPTKFGFLRLKEIRKKALDALAYFGHSEIKPDILVKELSVSAQQVVEIGRALALGCQVLVFDEPTSSLSQKDIQRLFELIKILKLKGLSIIYISHFLEEVQEISDRLTVLRDGKVVATHPTGAISTKKIVQMMVGRKIDEIYVPSQRISAEPVLEIENLAGVKKPSSATLRLHRGEVLGISGLVGAGRTELLRVIFGLDPVKKGEIKIGIFLGPASPVKRWLQGVGMLSENRKEEGLALNLSIADNVTLSNLKGFGPMKIVLPHRQNTATQNWIKELDIRCLRPQQPVQDLSGGNQQKVAFARLLQHDVDVLLLDEPTRGIDVAAKAKIYQVINLLASGNQQEKISPKAILMVSSYLPELLGVCDRVAVMYRGKLSPPKPVKDINEHELMLAATGQGEFF
jgi:ribose transport system ATP-binding protein